MNEKGKIFYNSVNDALALLERGKSSVTSTDSTPTGEIKILISTCRRIATQAIEKCRSNYPDIKFVIKHGFEDGDYDFIISDVPPSKKQFDKIHLLTERMLLAIPRSSKLFDKRDILSSIENEPFISLGKGTRLHTLTEQYCNSLGFTPNVALQTDDPYYVRKYLEMGLGVALFPEKSWAQMLSPEIKLADVGFPKRNVYLFTEKGANSTATEIAFKKILVSTFNEA